MKLKSDESDYLESLGYFKEDFVDWLEKDSFISCDTTGTRKLRAGISLTTKKKQQLGNYKSSKDKFQSLNLLSKEKMDGSSIVLNGKV